MTKLTATLAKDIAEKMRDLGYDCTDEQVQAVRAGKTLDHSAALAGNILQELREKGIKHEHEE